MNVRQRKRAGDAVAARMTELATTPTTVARAAGISTKTLRSLIRGERWPTEAVQARVEQVLRWPSGELATRAVLGNGVSVLADLGDVELAAELLRRLEARDRHRRREKSRRETPRPT